MHITIVIPCFKDALRAIALVESLSLQKIPDTSNWDVIVVCDGSGEPCTSTLIQQLTGRARVIPLAENVGRARARNIGANLARGDSLLFLDADCVPASPDLISCHLNTLVDGAVASLGAVSAQRFGFWGRYQNEALELKSLLPDGANWLRGSSANLMVSRVVFQMIGGFDENYRGYGFEDRDLLLRLQQRGRLAWARNAEVVHMDDISLDGICTKMREAGKLSASRFREEHPHEYAMMAYAKVDATQGWKGRFVARLGAALMGRALPVIDKWVRMDRLPIAMRFFAVRLSQAVAYSVGTMESIESKKSKGAAQR